MLGCLDLAAIAANFPGGLRPASPKVDSPQLKPAVGFPSQLRISYHDFYPNRAVLGAGSACSGGNDWECGPKSSSGTMRTGGEDDADASFVLRYLPFNHPHAYFDQCATLMADPAFDRLLERFAAGDEETRDTMNNHVQETLPMLRLFEVIGNWLASPRVAGFTGPPMPCSTSPVFDALTGCTG